ncbi:MAG TPA: hypothetical protein VLC28_16625 [Flavitalea sp.]|nr:hypothetical protein [Flavitalea sp.]
MVLKRLKIKKALPFLLVVLSINIQYAALAAFTNKATVEKSLSTIVLAAKVPEANTPKIKSKYRTVMLSVARHIIATQLNKYQNRSARHGKNTGGKIAILVVLFLLSAFLIFAIAYGGASGGVLILSGAVAVALLVWLGMKMFKPKRKN